MARVIQRMIQYAAHHARRGTCHTVQRRRLPQERFIVGACHGHPLACQVRCHKKHACVPCCMARVPSRMTLCVGQFRREPGRAILCAICTTEECSVRDERGAPK